MSINDTWSQIKIESKLARNPFRKQFNLKSNCFKMKPVPRFTSLALIKNDGKHDLYPILSCWKKTTLNSPIFAFIWTLTNNLNSQGYIWCKYYCIVKEKNGVSDFTKTHRNFDDEIFKVAFIRDKKFATLCWILILNVH